MKRMTRNELMLLLSGLIAVISLFVIYMSHNRDANDKVDYHCSTSFRMQHNDPGFVARLNIFLQVKRDGSAFFDIIGKVDYLGEIYDVARTYHFNYQKESDSVYHLTQMNISRRSPETVDDKLMNSLFFSTTQEGGQYMRVTKMKNSYVINNLHSPLFVCIVN
ncbi:hypothetical protein [Citrobacter sp. JGM124]|uniref:hypothetical protein n=1 Tax=Citrobacter sp. JGM124 TaxID=2799789 RepID=UPI001BAC056E|nr:hypothetical protein [Citrobacter sp. JGM124]MBS0849428.1 hypothetical protein [Citrobacter sp. JGM124]